MPEIDSLIANFPEKLGILFEPARYKVIFGGRGGGRCFAKGTLVMMYTGILRAVEDVNSGDLLMGPDSKPRRVLGATTAGTSMMYDVEQTGGGKTYTVNGNHVLTLKKSHSEGPRLRNGKMYHSSRYPNSPDTLNITVGEWVKKSKKFKSYYFGYKTESIDFSSTPTPIDPYFLGMWLGDGTSRELRLTVCHGDQEILDYCSAYVATFGNSMSVCTKQGVGAYDVGFPPAAGVYKNPVWQLFLSAGLANNKHIPDGYFTASEKDRLSLLAGLIDSDGWLHHNGYVFTNTNPLLAFGAKHIADFLGFKTNIYIKKANGEDRIQDAYNVSINGDTWRIPCLLKRKKIVKGDVNKNKDFSLRAISVVEKEVGEYFGFEVDGDHLFLLEDGTVVHNSWGCARALLLKAIARPLRVLCAREVQQSIRDSVHKLLGDQIRLLGLGEHFEILEKSIRVKNGGEFTFSGLSTQTVESIKSMEGVDIVWCFPAGTQVDGKSIEEIKEGDWVFSFNHATNLVERRRVLGTSKRKTPEVFYRLLT